MNNLNFRENVERIYNRVFLLLYFIWGLYFQVQNTVNINIPNTQIIGGIVNTLVLIVGMLLYFWRLGEKDFKLSYSEVIEIIILLGMGILVAKNQFGLTGLTIFMIILLASYVNFYSVVKGYLIFTTLVLFFTIFLNKISFIPSFVTIDSIRIRNSLGFRYVTFGAVIFFFYILAYVVYRNTNIKYSELFVLELINVIIFSAVRANDPFILSSLFLLYAFFIKLSKNKINYNKLSVIKFIERNIYIISFLLILVLTFCLPQNLFQEINGILSGRLSLNYQNIIHYGIKFFGQNIHFQTYDATTINPNLIQYNYVDSFYFQNLLLYGWPFLLSFLIIFTILMNKLIHDKDNLLIGAFVIMALQAMFEPQLLWIWYTPFPLIIGQIFTRKNDDLLL